MSAREYKRAYAAKHAEGIREYGRKWRAANRPRLLEKKRADWRTKSVAERKERNLRIGYGISLADYNALLTLQRGLCAVCELAFAEGQRPEVDHDHARGGPRGGPDKERLRASVRGVVHRRCNAMVGAVERGNWHGCGTPAERQRASAYLSRPYPFAGSA